MKKVFILLLSLGLVVAASAQRHGYGGYHYARPRVSIGVGIGAYAPFSPYYYGYSPYYSYGVPLYAYPHHSSKLDREIADITMDYNDKIWAVKHDHSLSHRERKRMIRDLKFEKEEKIQQARRDYYNY